MDDDDKEPLLELGIKEVEHHNFQKGFVTTIKDSFPHKINEFLALEIFPNYAHFITTTKYCLVDDEGDCLIRLNMFEDFNDFIEKYDSQNICEPYYKPINHELHEEILGFILGEIELVLRTMIPCYKDDDYSINEYFDNSNIFGFDFANHIAWGVYEEIVKLKLDDLFLTYKNPKLEKMYSDFKNR